MENGNEIKIAEPKKRQFSFKERILILAALAISILWDRLVLGEAAWNYFGICYSAFWIGYLVIFYALYWERVKKNKTLWYLAVCAALMGVWNFIYTSFESGYLYYTANDAYQEWTIVVIPCVLMAHAQFAAEDLTLRDVGKMALAWIAGWIIKPFTGIPACFGALYSSVTGERRNNVGKVLVAIAVLIPVMVILITLLSGADMMFGYYIKQILNNFDVAELIWHCFAIVVVFILFYSFLWNVGFGKKSTLAVKPLKVDSIISTIILGAVTVLYVIFFAVQFTYLFARAGLPPTMPSFAEYAREGFGQAVAVCAINLIIFGIFLNSDKKHLRAMLGVLLGLTVMMLVSGALRLNLYVDAYGLTWLRLLSAWFIVYLAAVIILCAVRMVRKDIPAVAIAAMVLIGWFLVLGFVNPDWLIYHCNVELGWA